MSPVRGLVRRTRNMVIVEQQELENEKALIISQAAHLCQRPAMLCTVFAPLCR